MNHGVSIFDTSIQCKVDFEWTFFNEMVSVLFTEFNQFQRYLMR